jgi:DNA polymerase III delta prime subunit
MPIDQSIPRVNIAQARLALMTAMEANVPVLFIGDPGVGKTAVTNAVARELKIPCATLIGSTCDPTDIGGLPVVRIGGNGLDRIPLNVINQVAEKPGLLFLDEIATAPPAVQAAMLRGLLERVFGDVALHPDSRVCGATNPPEQSPGGSELSAPLIGRVMMMHFQPSAEEVQSYFEDLGDDGSKLRAEASDFSLTCRVAPDLLEIAIPKSAEQGNVPWGAPRAWERAVRMLAALPEGTERTMQANVLAGNIGRPRAVQYMAIRDMRLQLPSVDDILRDPEAVMVPKEHDKQIGAVGLVARVAERDKWCGYIYANRLIPELRAACGKLLGKRSGQNSGPEANDPSPWRKKGSLARLDILKSIPKSALGGAGR